MLTGFHFDAVRRTLGVALAVLAAAACTPDDGEDACDPPCNEAYQACRAGLCRNVCPYYCGPSAHCDFETGRCVMDVSDAGDETGACGPDRDGDTLPDLLEGEGDPDGDTLANADDDDSDGDTIRDRDEEGDRDCTTTPSDYDGDTVYDFLDLDSDADGYPDAEEAGDDRPETRPRDTDGWAAPDFRDSDSDNDGLSDRQERTAGTDRTELDTDGDTFTDLEEWGYEPADPLDAAVGIPAEASVERVPYDASSVRRSFDFTVEFKQVDLVVLLGCAAEAAPALADLSAGFAEVVAPAVSTTFRGGFLGTALFGDGRTLAVKTGTSVARLAAGTDAAARWSASLQRLPSCADGASAALTGEALAEVVDGRPLDGLPAPAACPAGTFGLTCLRAGALPIVLLAVPRVYPEPGTAPAAGGARTLEAARLLLQSIDGRVIPVRVGPDAEASTELRDLAVAFGSIGPGGVPLLVEAGDGGTAGAEALAFAVQDATRRLTQDVELVALDIPDDPPPADPSQEVDASKFAYFIDAYRFSPAPGFSREESVSRTSGSVFYGALRGVEVGYRVYFRNGDVQGGPDGRRFLARLVGRTRGGTVIAAWPVTFLLPASVGDVDDGR